MKSRPVYVQTKIETTMEEIWEYTQNPRLHTEWDVRFTEITYLPKEVNEPQSFLYKTKIGFGLEIAGKGESVGEIRKNENKRVSSLKFWTDNPLSLIHIGRGYWKYEQKEKDIIFETQYDYETNFGKVGKLIDQLLFRPLISWGTAWSFDSLKMWLEKGYHPHLLLKRTLTYWLTLFVLAFVWVYQGLVPKLIFAHPEEISLLQNVMPYISSIKAEDFVRIIGIVEVMFGIVWLLPFQKRKLFIIHMIGLIGLTLIAFLADSQTFFQPFNVVTLNGMLILFSIIGYVNSSNLPRASNCIRKRKG